MRRLKMVVYLLILGILSSLLGNVSFAWASTQDKLVITEIYDLDLASAPLMFPVGSHIFRKPFRLTVIALSTPSVKMKTRARN